MQYSVELEPPKGKAILTKVNSQIKEEILKYIPHVYMFSITDRPTFGLSSTAMTRLVNECLSLFGANHIRSCLHLTTRISWFDIYSQVLESINGGVTDIMPILGDPRGPKVQNYFRNGFEILGFVSYMRSGDPSLLPPSLSNYVENEDLIAPLAHYSFKIASVVNTNSVQTIQGKTFNIREKEIRNALRKQVLGADYLICQGIISADDYFSFKDEASLDIPIVPSIIPLRKRLISAFGLPCLPEIMSQLNAANSVTEERIVGNVLASSILSELEDGGEDHVHIFSLGNYENFEQITGMANLTRINSHFESIVSKAFRV